MSSGRIRTVKPEWLEDELLAATSDSARVLSIALILMADDYGRGRASIATFAAETWRFELERDDGANAPEVLAKASRAFRELVEATFVVPYEVDRQRYFWLRSWDKHQKVDKPGKPRVPPPPADLIAKYTEKNDGREVVARVPEEVATVSRESRDNLAPDLGPGPGPGPGPGRDPRACPPVDEPSRLAQALMLAHGALAPDAAAISAKSRAESGAVLHERARTLRAEIDDGTTIQALGDEVLIRFVETFAASTSARVKGYPPQFLVTALRGEELQRAADLVRHAHGLPASMAWKGPRPPMRHVAPEDATPWPEMTPEEVAALEEETRTGKTRTQIEREQRARGQSR